MLSGTSRSSHRSSPPGRGWRSFRGPTVLDGGDAPLRSRHLACLLLPATAQAAKDPVLTTLSQIEARGGTSATDAQAWRGDYKTAKVAARTLKGTPQTNIRGVLLNLTSLAKRHLLGSRGYPAFLILRHNLEWFYEQRRSAPAYGTRTTFAGSELIFQYYPGSGWQLQPLANFGRLNGLLKLRKPAAGRLEKFADDMLATGVQRRGSLAFEYYFPWTAARPDGSPGWRPRRACRRSPTSASATATLGYADAARSMIGVFKAPPPWGVSVQGAGRPELPALFAVAERARRQRHRAGADRPGQLPRRDRRCGRRSARRCRRWRRPSACCRSTTPARGRCTSAAPTKPGVESDLSYHQLFEGFLKIAVREVGRPVLLRRPTTSPATKTEPVPGQLRSRRRSRLKRKRIIAGFVLNKRGTIRVTLERAGVAVRAWSGSMFRGKHTLTWTLPPKGDDELVVKATSLNGIASEATSTATVARSARSPRHR